MAFGYINVMTGDILDILDQRTSRTIKDHFIANYSKATTIHLLLIHQIIFVHHYIVKTVHSYLVIYTLECEGIEYEIYSS